MESTSQNQTTTLEVDELKSTKQDDESIKKSRETSDIWMYFKKMIGIDKAECNGCKKQYKCGGKHYGTSTLWRHLKICDKLKFHDVGQMILDQDGKMRSKKIDQKISRELLACAIIRHDLPFSFVEYDGIRDWMKYINSDIACISRNTLVSDINRIYLREKEKLNEEWKRGEKICEFLEPFYDTTNLISGSSYPTSNLYFMQVWKIEVLLKENLSNEDEVISSMCKRMMEKFDKYWTQYSMVLAFGAILDPRIKLSMLEFFYTKVESDYVKFQKKMELVKTKLYKLFDQYSNTSKTSSSQCQPQCSSTTNTHQQSVGGVKGKNKRIFDEIMAYESQTITSAGKSQLDLYLEEPKLEFAYYQDLNVLEHWKNQNHRYPTLALMACDVLAIPITTVASESAFSIGSRVLTKYRSCTLHEKVQALICTRNWLHGYAIDKDNEDNEEKLDVALDSLLNVEKQMRLAGDVAGTKKALIDILELYLFARLDTVSQVTAASEDADSDCKRRICK
ncbi:hypothetical protein ZIOFF_010877 [Zingiber officinale]|uniref:BED-type domain-containing protein n=1 Tax=Zingiber officinale TaxID=94328 RepID=A0A8J5LSD1_ZINOF|nr:hypothetical protein ZIOFF_010877 [Zingiber officinale]